METGHYTNLMFRGDEAGRYLTWTLGQRTVAVAGVLGVHVALTVGGTRTLRGARVYLNSSAQHQSHYGA